MTDLARRVTVLERENDALRDRVYTLERALGLRIDAPLCLGLSNSEAKLFGVMMAREIMTKEAAYAVLYSGQIDDRDPKVIDVMVCKMRKKLANFGVEIGTVWGRGYLLSPAAKEIVRALDAEQAAA